MSFAEKAGRIFAKSLCIAIALMMVLSLFGALSFADQGDELEIMLVVDNSGSVKETDKNNLIPVAIDKFCDAFSQSANLKLGIGAYDTNLVPGSLSLGQTKEDVRRFANNLQPNGNTDAAEGVKWAVNELVTKGSQTATKAVILIGDGENDLRPELNPPRTEAESDENLEKALQEAESNGVKIFTLAVNSDPQNPYNNPDVNAFREYFKNIATRTGAKSYDPQSAEEITKYMYEIYKDITNDSIDNDDTIDVEPGIPSSQNIDVPQDVFEMTLQCDYKTDIEISLKDTDGHVYDETSKDGSYEDHGNFVSFKVLNPKPGKWVVTYLSDTKQTIKPTFIFHKDVAVDFTKDFSATLVNESEILLDQNVKYTASLIYDNSAVTDNSVLSQFTAQLVTSRYDKDGNKEAPEKYDMEIYNGEIYLTHKLSKPGKYDIFVELSHNNQAGNTAPITSNVLSADLVKEPDPFLWLKILIPILALILIIALIIIVNALRNAGGSGYVKGKVVLRISGRQSSGESMVFMPEQFDCNTVLSKKNTLSDLINAYRQRYMINNSGALAERTVNQFINTTLTQVTDKVTICGTKVGKTVIVVPEINEMQLDGMDVKKSRTITFQPSPVQRDIELRFKNQGCSYTINLAFTAD